MKTLPGIVLWVMALMMGIVTLQAQETVYADSWGPAGMNLERQDAAGLRVGFSLERFMMEAME
ncbi:MAG: hypothetical protein JW861_10415, partial [Bacteroidales bacterium]|nr:hypothetical protein [Bacteroidales bacterium]